MSKYLIAPPGKHGVPLIERLMQRVVKTEDCWIWISSKSPGGYGKASYRIPGEKWSKTRSAHRVIYELLIGEVPKNLDLDHLCRNRLCVNPEHLEPVTRRENIRRGENLMGENMRKTHCKWGHEFTPENTRPIITPYGYGGRDCRACIKRNNDKRKGG